MSWLIAYFSPTAGVPSHTSGAAIWPQAEVFASMLLARLTALGRSAQLSEDESND